MKKLVTGAGALGAMLIGTAAWAQGATGGSGGYRPATLWEAILSTVVFSLLGIVLAIVGFKLFDLAIKFDIEREICEKNNLAAAILASAVVLGTCIIVGLVVIS